MAAATNPTHRRRPRARDLHGAPRLTADVRALDVDRRRLRRRKAAAAAAAGAGGGYIAEDDEIPPEVAAIVGPRPAFRLLLPTPQLNALIEEALEAVTMQRGGELHMPE